MKEIRAPLRQRILAGILVTLALSLVGNWIMGSGPAATVMAPVFVDAKSVVLQADNKRARNFSLSDPTLHLTQLESSEQSWYTGTGRNIFWYAENETKKIPPESNPGKSESEARLHKTETSLTFFGYALMGNVPKRVFLKDGDALFVAREGDVFDRRYKVIKVEQNSIDVEDLVEQRTLKIELQG